jgi:hypothetical protein
MADQPEHIARGAACRVVEDDHIRHAGFLGGRDRVGRHACAIEEPVDSDCEAGTDQFGHDERGCARRRDAREAVAEHATERGRGVANDVEAVNQ